MTSHTQVIVGVSLNPIASVTTCMRIFPMAASRRLTPPWNCGSSEMEVADTTCGLTRGSPEDDEVAEP